MPLAYYEHPEKLISLLQASMKSQKTLERSKNEVKTRDMLIGHAPQADIRSLMFQPNEGWAKVQVSVHTALACQTAD